MDNILKVSGLTKQFSSGTGQLTVLSDVTFSVREKSGMAIVATFRKWQDHAAWALCGTRHTYHWIGNPYGHGA